MFNVLYSGCIILNTVQNSTNVFFYLVLLQLVIWLSVAMMHFLPRGATAKYLDLCSNYAFLSLVLLQLKILLTVAALGSFHQCCYSTLVLVLKLFMQP